MQLRRTVASPSIWKSFASHGIFLILARVHVLMDNAEQERLCEGSRGVVACSPHQPGQRRLGAR